jgi:hypothetical protein
MYRNGEGVVKDYKTAFKWYTLAAEQGHAWAQTNLKSLAKKMTPADISAAQKLTRECVKKNFKGC